MKELHYNVTGQDRKELVGIISKVVGMNADLRLCHQQHHR